jgi:type VI secretion system protein ImpL
MKIEWKAGGAFLMYFAVVFAWAQIYGFGGSRVYYVVGMLSALGLTGASLWVWITKKKEKEEAIEQAASNPAAAAASGGAAGDAAIDQLINEADQRVSQSSATQGAKVANLPMVFVVGDQGSTKTSALVYSGIEPELLAGAVYGEGNAVASTQHINVWFARGSTFVEAAGKVFADPGRWRSLVRRLKPGSWKNIMGTGEQAPRGVLLCYDVENFAKPGAAEQIATASRYIQARLSDISDGLGISYPVYILFTRTDRIPFFQEFVRNLSNEEATQVFGSTLNIRDQQTGVYAEEETRRLTKAFDDLFYSLADKRCVLLPRDQDPLKTPQPYEFPREFRKLRQSIVQFMVDCCRPSQLKASPFLRGFYFSGVRPITVSSAPVVTASKQENDAFKQAGAATQMFSAAMLKAQAQQSAMAGAQQPGRRVPQWLFLGHLFNDILLKDTLAMGASGSSVKTSGLQRILLGLAAALLTLYSIGLVVSFFGNKGLEDQAIVAAKGLADVRADMKACEAPSIDQLQRLETIRQSLLQLTEYEEKGAPWRLRLGLYAGSDMYPEVRKSYYDRFKALLFGGTQTGLIANMKKYGAKGKPEATDSFDVAYDDVKAYLLTTSEYVRVKNEKDRRYGDFLGRTLHARWGCRPEEIGSQRLELARKQFDFYANDLVNGNPYSTQRDPSVPPAQAYLREFSGEEAAFQGLLAKADRESGPKTFNEFLQGSAANVIGNVPVRYGFTKKGYEFMSKAIDKADFGSEPWVLGEGGSSIPPEELKKRVRERYAKAYIEIWRNVAKKAAFIPYGGLANAKDRLPAIASNTAPIPGLFWWVSHNTGIDLPGVKQAFAPMHAVQPPSDNQQFITGQLGPYNGSILNLMGPVEAALQQGADSFMSAQNLKDSARNAEMTTMGIAAALPVDSEAALHTTIRDLMLRPITSLPVPKAGGEIDAAGGAFCRDFMGLTNKFPFNYKSPIDVSLPELETIFKTGGHLSKLQTDLAGFVQCSSIGNIDCQQAPTAKARINPAFLRFMSQTLQLQKALYPDGQNLNYKFAIKVQSEFYDRFKVSVSGDQSALNNGQETKPYAFTANSSGFAIETIQKGNASGPNNVSPGFWGVFHHFAKADTISGNSFTFFVYSGQSRQKAADGRDLSYDLILNTFGQPVIFSRDVLRNLQCVPKVVLN